MTVDELEDLEMVQWLVSELGPQKNWLEYANHMLNNKRFLKNSKIKRNEGYFKSLEQDKNE
jgi:predicted HD phosphohydrolase